MSKPASPAPGKPNILSTVMFAIAAALIFRMWTTPPQREEKFKTSESVLAELKRIDAIDAKTTGEAQENNDVTVWQLLPSYDKFLKEDVERKTVTQGQADVLKTQASILAAHIQLKNGIASHDTNKLRMAYNTLESFERTEGSKPVWTSTPVEVTENGTKKQTTGQEFLGHLVAQISERNKSDLIWGAIPGGYQFVDLLVGLSGRHPEYSYALATLLPAFLVRGAVFPLSQKQLMMSRKMSQLTPRLKEIKDRFKDDQIEANKRSMELYSRYGINPLAGCLPALVQLPLFFTVYQCILHYQFEFTKGRFLWINPQASAASHGFFAPNLGQQDYLLIVIYSVTMIISTLLTPVTDPTQARQQKIMGVGVAIIYPIFMFLRVVPVVSGFVLYWTFTNLFSMAQSLRAYRLPMPELVEVNAPGGGVFPGKPKGRWAQMMEDFQRQAEEQQKAQKGDREGPADGVAVKTPKDKAPQGGTPGVGKISPSRPVGEVGGADGNPAKPKSKPKKRK